MLHFWYVSGSLRSSEPLNHSHSHSYSGPQPSLDVSKASDFRDSAWKSGQHKGNHRASCNQCGHVFCLWWWRGRQKTGRGGRKVVFSTETPCTLSWKMQNVSKRSAELQDNRISPAQHGKWIRFEMNSRPNILLFNCRVENCWALFVSCLRGASVPTRFWTLMILSKAHL